MTTEYTVKEFAATKRRKRSSFKTITGEEDCKKAECYMYMNRRTQWDFDICCQFCIGEKLGDR